MPAAKRFTWVALLAPLVVGGGWGTTTPARAGADLVLLANRDDDDGDGIADADDVRVNGEADERDLGELIIPLPAGTSRVALSAGDAPLRFFRLAGGVWRDLGRGDAEVAVRSEDGRELRVHVEAASWAGMPAAWTGSAVIHVDRTAAGAKARPLAIPVRVAPVRLMPGTAPVTEAFVATGRYDNAGFVEQLRSLLDEQRVPLREHPARDWREMWMQDTMEIGVSTTARGSMSVVLAGLRGADSFPPTLLGPDVAVAEVAGSRRLSGGDAWADWYGNLEVSVPTETHPFGRVIVGRNRLTGCSFHPDVVAFLDAQGVQKPIWIDTSWLLIKHVDEIVSFLPGPDGKGVILVPDPAEGLKMLDQAGDHEQVARRRREANARIAAEIDALLHGAAPPPRSGVAGAGGLVADSKPAISTAAGAGGLLALLGLDDLQVIRLPVAFDVPDAAIAANNCVTGAASVWSNPVNSLIVGGTVICGSASMPDDVRDVCRKRFLAAGATRVEFVDDSCYHRNHGNVHCATNTRRLDDAHGGTTDR